MTTIRAIISQRTDLSTFVVHLTRDAGGQTAREALQGVLARGCIEARNPMGSAVGALRDAGASAAALNSQRVVCFTETPLEHLHFLFEEIEDANRICEFRPYGIAVTKKVARMTGVNPVWYVDMSPGHDWLMNPLNRLIETAIAAGHFETSDIARIAPFVEQMGTHSGGMRKEFWWEREWRHNGDYNLPEHFILLAPEQDHTFFAAEITRLGLSATYVDPTWGLEEIVARLAGFRHEQVAVF